MVLEEAAKFSSEVLAPLNSIADKEGCIFEKGKVRVPEAFHDAFKKFCEGGWIASSVDVESGGQGLPESVGIAASEMFTGACASASIYIGLTRGAFHLIESFGTQSRRNCLGMMYRTVDRDDV
jgi:alkylation response protein AidB-like acyl-CoA dehydrogenase